MCCAVFRTVSTCFPFYFSFLCMFRSLLRNFVCNCNFVEQVFRCVKVFTKIVLAFWFAFKLQRLLLNWQIGSNLSSKNLVVTAGYLYSVFNYFKGQQLNQNYDLIIHGCDSNYVSQYCKISLA